MLHPTPWLRALDPLRLDTALRRKIALRGVDDARGGLDPSILAAKTGGRPSVWPMFLGFLILCLIVFVGGAFTVVRIPTHGDVLGLTYSECVPLLWVPLSAFVLARPGTPRRWWSYYGLVCCIVLLPALRSYIFHGGGRRPWCLNPRWFSDGGLLMAYLVVSPFLAATVRLLMAAGRVRAPSTRAADEELPGKR